ncbi:recombinase family protein [uncultured Endozoicomonas sp.]|uniref:recombinase family protein n=1 Tax=uncultured Endozoicomonas sp. TaxID=432652 RepID=UPI002619BEF7|nr:recombinase family protein [uncultured Endozoicomonas sp.]
MKAYSYLRISTPEQAKGSGIARQLQQTETYCTEKGLNLIESLQDVGLSGYHKKNLQSTAALGSFLEAIQSGKVQTPCALVVESLDRISRASITDALAVFMQLINAGCELHTLSDKQVYSASSVNDNWTQLIISLSVMARGREESQIKSDRIKAAYQQKYQQGQVYGRSYPAWLDKTSEGFSLNPEKTAILRRIIKLYQSGYGCKKIAGLLNSEGTKGFTSGTNNRTGNQYWFQTTISKYIKSPALCGHQQSKQGLIKDCYPAVLTEDQFNLLQSQRKANTKLAGSAAGNCNSVFTGIGKCHHCGYSLQYSRYKTRAGYKHYLRCRASLREGTCKAPSVPYYEAEGYALLALERLIQGVYSSSEDNSKADAIQLKQSEIERLQDQTERLTSTLLLVDSGTVPAIQQKLTAAAQELQQAQADLALLQQEKAAQNAAQSDSDLQQAAAFINGITDDNRITARALLHRHCSTIGLQVNKDDSEVKYRLVLTSKHTSQQAEAINYRKKQSGSTGTIRLIHKDISDLNSSLKSESERMQPEETAA